jgi:hypothetical protein
MAAPCHFQEVAVPPIEQVTVADPPVVTLQWKMAALNDTFVLTSSVHELPRSSDKDGTDMSAAVCTQQITAVDPAVSDMEYVPLEPLSDSSRPRPQGLPARSLFGRIGGNG